MLSVEGSFGRGFDSRRLHQLCPHQLTANRLVCWEGRALTERVAWSPEKSGHLWNLSERRRPLGCVDSKCIGKTWMSLWGYFEIPARLSQSPTAETAMSLWTKCNCIAVRR